MAISTEGGMSAALAASGVPREPGPTGLGKKRTLSLGAISRSDLPTKPTLNVLSSPAGPTTPVLPGAGITPTTEGGLLSSALSRSFGAGGGLSAALRSHSAVPRIAVGEVDASGAPLSPLSSATPLSRTPTEAVPMPRRKYPKQAEGDAAGSAGSQEDEFDSAAMPLSVRDPGFIAPHLLLSMSLPTNGADFGRGVFRPGSVMEGRGRKLCGIDASRVRNDILRQTGFLEPGDNPLSSGSVSGGP